MSWFNPTHTVSKNVANLYIEPNTDSALDTQAILGDPVEVLEEQNNYCRVRSKDRNESGWTDRRWLVDYKNNALPNVAVSTRFADVYTESSKNAQLLTRVVLSTQLRVTPSEFNNGLVNIVLPNKQTAYIAKENISKLGTEPIKTERLALNEITAKAVAHAKDMVGTPYLWGGCTPFGIDCSGLIQLVYYLAGFQLRRNANQQFADRRFVRIEEGKRLFECSFQPGDLIVFARNEKINHIGIAVNNDTFIHAGGWASGRGGVVFEPITSDFYNPFYAGAVRLIKNEDIEFA